MTYQSSPFYIATGAANGWSQGLCSVIQRHDREIRLIRQTLDKQGKEIKSLHAAVDAQGLKINWLVSGHERTVAQLANQRELIARQASDIERLQHGIAPFTGDFAVATLIGVAALLVLVAKVRRFWPRRNATTPQTPTTEELIATLLGRFQAR